MNEIKSEIKQSLEEDMAELKELHEHVRKNAKEISSTAADDLVESIALHRMENGIRHEKIAAEINHIQDERELKRIVEKETEELKSSLNK